ncbi:MlaC/ttg2D family ABC transporter substrate-binding protein [Marinobacterium rhizophilum]|uniref:ABC transporter substrate-binding protein n=1 Tax=Marinobacterium rhizophilum TaxID=420402 RepID=A0ABY5HNK7_9GAMM|nr:ABC transporter substrate-binding protein [Marinobacterium rhizophilum]UTW13995.1 ABC transporter substrate-binding protein [Marinobacterium rhizophilum]
MKRLLTSVALICSLLLPTLPAQASWEAASGVIEKVTQDMVALLEEGVDINDEASLNAAMGRVEERLDGMIDFDYISQRVMGKFYRRANDAERAHFASVFKHTMVKTYTKALAGFEINRVEVAAQGPESPEPDKQVVTLEVYSGAGTKYSLVNYMLERDGQWQLVNVILDGINLRLTFTNQFADLAERNNGNIQRVIDSWESQVDGRVAKSEGS